MDGKVAPATPANNDFFINDFLSVICFYFGEQYFNAKMDSKREEKNKVV